MCQEYPRIHRNGFVLSCWNRNNNKVSHFFIYIIYRREGETECFWCARLLRSLAHSRTLAQFATRQVLYLCIRITTQIASTRSLAPSLFVCTLFPVLFTARHFGMCMHKLFTCSVPSVQTVRINASQATLVSCVVFYYYAVINFLSLPLFVVVVVVFFFHFIVCFFCLAWPGLENHVFETCCYSINTNVFALFLWDLTPGF